MEQKLIFLGTGASVGVPSLFCSCQSCQHALDGVEHGRTRSSVLICGEETILVDCSPDLRSQLARERVQTLDRVVLTHDHYDHVGGLGELEFAVRIAREGRPLPVYCTNVTARTVQERNEFMVDCLHLEQLEAGDSIVAGGLSMVALDTNHAPGTIGVLIEGEGGRRTAYVPDTGPLPRSTTEILGGIDTLILDATYWGESMMPDDHLSLDEAVQIGLDLEVKQLYLTHLSMHYSTPVTSRELKTYLSSRGDNLHLAYDGLRLEL